MRLKFYLMGLGIGVIVAAVIMGIAMRGRTREMTDEEIMARARQLGMVEAGTLAEMTSGENNQNADQNVENLAQTAAEAPQNTQTQERAPESGASAADGSSGGAGIAGSADGAQTAAAGATGAEGAAQGAENGTDRGENGAADNGESGTANMVVEGEPVDDETDEAAEADGTGAETDSAGTETVRAGASDGESAADGDEDRQGDSVNASDTNAQVTRTGASGTGTPDGGAQASGSIVVTIPDGLYSEDIASLLETAGVVDNAASFNDYLVNSGMDRYITVGARLIPRGSSYEEVARIITGR